MSRDGKGVTWYPSPYPKVSSFIDLQGEQYGRLTVISFAGRSASRHKPVWLCRCECGNLTHVVGETMRSQNHPVVSCGCWRREKCLEKTRTHGASKTREYRIWLSMKERCDKPSNDHYHRYGGRGITVCERWRANVESFLADMGPRPSRAHSVERLDNDGNYEPGNCVWATNTVQSRNRSNNRYVTFQGRRMAASEAAEIVGIKPLTLLARLRMGWPEHEAITVPVEKQRGPKRRVQRV